MEDINYIPAVVAPLQRRLEVDLFLRSIIFLLPCLGTPHCWTWQTELRALFAHLTNPILDGLLQRQVAFFYETSMVY